jgi:hypothetical protein
MKSLTPSTSHREKMMRSGRTPSLRECRPCRLSTGFERYVDSLEALRAQGKLRGIIGASFTHGFAADALLAAMRRAGLTALPETPENVETPDSDALTVARLQGRRVAEAVRALKAHASV